MTIPLVICVLGLILYFATEGKPSEVGRIAFAFGLLVTLLSLAGMRLF